MLPQQLTGLGVIDTDLCLWGESLPPGSERWLYLVPALPTIKMKTMVYPQPGGEMQPEPQPVAGEGIVCSINRWVNEHPILAVAALIGAGLVLGEPGPAPRTRRRR